MITWAKGMIHMDKIRLFIVDDEPMSIQYFKSFFVGCDRYEVVGEAYDGKRAYEEIKRVNPDLIFADISMPVMDGLILAEKLLEEDKNTKIILLTSYRDFDYAKKGLELGVTSYLLKHEIDQKLLWDEIEKTMEKVLIQKRRDKQLFDHNLKKFMTSCHNEREDIPFCSYRKKDNFFLMEVIENVPLVTGEKKAEGAMDKINWGEIENYKEQCLWCRGILDIKEGHWLVLCFIEPAYNYSILREEIYKFGNKIQALFRSNYYRASILISETTGNFYELPYIYKELIEFEDIVQFMGLENIIYRIDLKLRGHKKIDSNLTLALLGELHNGEEKSKQCIKNILESAVGAGKIKEFRTIIEDVLKILDHFSLKEQIDFNVFEQKKDLYTIEDTEAWLEELVYQLFAEKEKNRNYGFSPNIRMALYFMQKNYGRNISVLEIAEACNLSESYLRKCFKQETGGNIVDYLTNIRIAKAKELLKDQNCKVIEVYHKVGFTSSQYFSNVFKKITGHSPSEYKKLNS